MESVPPRCAPDGAPSGTWHMPRRSSPPPARRRRCTATAASRATTSRNVSNSARNAGRKRSMKNRCGCPDGNSTPGLQRPDRPALVHTGGDAVLRAVHLEPDVVAAAVVAGVGDDAEGAVREGHDRGGGVGVVVLLEELGALIGAGGVDLDGLLARDEPDDVEVVHAAVAVHPAGHRHVRLGRRLRVQRGGPDAVDPAQLAAVDRRLGRGDRGVVAALEADLHRHRRALQAAQQLRALRAVGPHRLLAQRRQARLHGRRG